MDNWRRQSKHRIYPVEIIRRPTSQLETKEAANEVTPTEGNEAETPATAAPIATERRYDRFTSCKHRSGEKNTVSSETGEYNPGRAKSPVRIMITIKATNGLHISQPNLDYNGVCRLVEMEVR